MGDTTGNTSVDGNLWVKYNNTYVQIPKDRIEQYTANGELNQAGVDAYNTKQLVTTSDPSIFTIGIEQEDGTIKYVSVDSHLADNYIDYRNHTLTQAGLNAIETGNSGIAVATEDQIKNAKTFNERRLENLRKKLSPESLADLDKLYSTEAQLLAIERLRALNMHYANEYANMQNKPYEKNFLQKIHSGLFGDYRYRTARRSDQFRPRTKDEFINKDVESLDGMDRAQRERLVKTWDALGIPENERNYGYVEGTDGRNSRLWEYRYYTDGNGNPTWGVAGDMLMPVGVAGFGAAHVRSIRKHINDVTSKSMWLNSTQGSPEQTIRKMLGDKHIVGQELKFNKGNTYTPRSKVDMIVSHPQYKHMAKGPGLTIVEGLVQELENKTLTATAFENSLRAYSKNYARRQAKTVFDTINSKHSVRGQSPNGSTTVTITTASVKNKNNVHTEIVYTYDQGKGQWTSKITQQPTGKGKPTVKTGTVTDPSTIIALNAKMGMLTDYDPATGNFKQVEPSVWRRTRGAGTLNMSVASMARQQAANVATVTHAGFGPDTMMVKVGNKTVVYDPVAKRYMEISVDPNTKKPIIKDYAINANPKVRKAFEGQLPKAKPARHLMPAIIHYALGAGLGMGAGYGTARLGYVVDWLFGGYDPGLGNEAMRENGN
jgi:hypothetical protein